MECLKAATFDSDDKNLQKAGPMSAYHHYVLSSILPDAEREYMRVQKKNKALEKENELLKNKVDFLMTDAEQFKAERQKIHKVTKNRDHLRNQLMHCKNELLVLGKKMGIQQTDLKRGRKQNETLKEELESVKKELQSLKKGVIIQRTEQQNLKERLDQVMKEKDGLNDKWMHCQSECSELCDKIIIQQSSLTRKDSQCKEQVKEIHYLKLENQKLEKERSIMENDAEDQKRELQKCEEELHTQREKLRESKRCRIVGGQLGKRIVILQQRPQMFRKPSQEVPCQKIESLQKELHTQTEELRKTQKLCEELKQNLTQVAAQFQLCQVTIRNQKEKLKAVTAEKNMYRSVTEKLGKELPDVTKGQHNEKQRNNSVRAAKRTKRVKQPSKDKLSQPHPSPISPKLLLKTGNKSNQPAPISSELQAQSDLRIIGTKM